MAENLRAQFDKLAHKRATAFEEARRSAAMTVPQVFLDEEPAKFDQTVTQHPLYQIVGRQGVSNLSNLLLETSFPSGLRWFNYKPINEEDEDPAKQLEEDAVSLQEQHQMRALMWSFYRQNLIEGNSVVQLTIDKEGHTGLRTIPFRDHVKEVVDGRVVRLIVRSVKEVDETNEAVNIYTLVDYQNNKVFKQDESDKRRMNPVESDIDHPSFYIPVTSTRAPNLTYPHSYVSEFLPDLWYVNNLRKDLADAYAIYAKMFGVVDSNQLSATKEDLAFADPGTMLDGTVNPDGTVPGIGWVTAGIKPRETEVARQEIERVEQQIFRQFGGSISSIFGDLASPRSATEVQQTASELNRFVNGIAQHYVTTLLQPLALAYRNLVARQRQIENDALSADILESDDAPQVNIIAGTAQLNELQNFGRQQQALFTMAQLFPSYVQNIIDPDKVFTSMMDALGQDADDLRKSDDELREEQQARVDLEERQQQILRQQRIAENANESQ